MYVTRVTTICRGFLLEMGVQFPNREIIFDMVGNLNRKCKIVVSNFMQIDYIAPRAVSTNIEAESK